MIVKKIHCLACNKILDADYDNGVTFVECGCDNGTSLSNEFRISQPGSYVRAIDKTKVKAQALSDIENSDIKSGDWFYLIPPETVDTPKYTQWLGRYGGSCSGFIEGLAVKFKTDKPMTFSECRTHLKTNNVTGSEGQIYHLSNGIKDS